MTKEDIVYQLENKTRKYNELVEKTKNDLLGIIVDGIDDPRLNIEVNYVYLNNYRARTIDLKVNGIHIYLRLENNKLNISCATYCSVIKSDVKTYANCIFITKLFDNFVDILITNYINNYTSELRNTYDTIASLQCELRGIEREEEEIFIKNKINELKEQFKNGYKYFKHELVKNVTDKSIVTEHHRYDIKEFLFRKYELKKERL